MRRTFDSKNLELKQKKQLCQSRTIKNFPRSGKIVPPSFLALLATDLISEYKQFNLRKNKEKSVEEK